MIPRPFRRATVFLLAAVCAASGPAADMFDDPSNVSILVELGLHDKTPRSWNGSVRVRGGELSGIVSRRPRPDDVIDGASWQLASWQGPNHWYPPEKPPSDPPAAVKLILLAVESIHGYVTR